MADQTITLRLRADGGELSAASGKAVSDIKAMGAAAAGASQQADQLSESEGEAAQRIRDMVRASGEAKAALGGVAESQRSVAERAREASQATAGQASALDSIVATQARMRATVDAMTAAEERQARAARAAADATKAESGDLTELLGKIDPVVKKLGELDVLERRLRDARKAGKIGGEDYDTYAAKIDKTRTALVNAEAGVHRFSLANAGAVREVGVLAGELSRGDFDRFGSSMLVLANRTNALPAIFTGVGAAVAATVVALVALVAIYAKGAEQSAALNRALIATGGYAGVTAGQVEVMAQRIGEVDGKAAQAREALTALIATGKVAGAQLEDAARAAKAFADVTGTELADGVKEIAKLGDDPSKAVLELNDKFHFLTASVFEHIQALQQQGDQEGATAAAMKAAADELEKRRETIVENAGYIERAWNSAKGAVLGFIDSLASIGRDTTAETRLGEIKTELASIESLRTKYARGGFLASIGSALGATDRLDTRAGALLAEQKALEDQKKVTDDLARSQAAQQKVQDDGIKALAEQSKALVDSAGKQEKLAAAVAKVREQFDKIRASGVTQINGIGIDEAEAKRIAQVNEQYKEHAAAVRDTAGPLQRLADLRARMAAIDDNASNSLSALEKETNRYDAELQAIARNEAQQILLIDQLRLGAEAEAQAHEQANAARERAAATHDQNAAAIHREQAAIVGKLAADNRYSLSLVTMTAREKAVAQAAKQAADYYAKNAAVFNAAGVSLDTYTENAKAAAAATFDIGRANQAVQEFTVESPILKMTDQIGDLEKALKLVSDRNSEAFNPALAEKYTKAIAAANNQLGVQMVGSYAALLGAARAFTTEGSKSYQQITAGMAALQLVQDALALRAAIVAVLTQGEGEPYSAWARMAAMAAAVAPILASIGQTIASIGGGGGAPGADSAEVRQKLQGTGTILGDAEAKSESIAKATEITANATQQLVGLNRGMLTALQALQNALGAAGNQLARGAADVDFGRTLSGGDTAPIGSAIGNAIIGFVNGGKQKIIDSGIIIMGGTLRQMMEDIVVGAYQTVQTDGGLFGSDSTDEDVSDVSAAFSKQFQLVIKSIVDTVREGALALGLLPEDVEKALAAYKLEEIRISLKGLSAEDQQKELEAVFSSIFDGVAGAVVPFIEQFQAVGEGLGETLVRIATEVQVVQEGFKQLGIAIDTTDPERVAQISDALIQAAGGIDEFISGLNSFVANFSSGAYQLGVNSAALSSAFEQVGLTVPTTRDGMWELMQSLDATTEQGREQIATLLRLADVSDAYYSQLDEFAKKLGLDSGSELKKELQSIRDSALALGQAMRRAGASTEELQRIADAAFERMKEAIEAVRSAAQDQAYSLGLTDTPGSLDEINSEIERLQSIAASGSSNVRGFGNAVEEAANRARDAISLLIGDKSPLNDMEKLEVARGGLMAGTITQDQFLEIARRLFGSTRQYETEFAFAQRFHGAGSSVRDDGGAGGPAGLTGSQSERLAALLEQQQQLQAAATLAQYRDLAQQYAELAAVDGKSFLDELAAAGIDIDKFAKGLGLDGADGLAAYGDTLKAQIDAQGESAASIVDAIYWLGDLLTGTTNIKPIEPSNHPHGDDGADAGGGTLSTVQVDRPASDIELRTMSDTSDMAATMRDVKALLGEILTASRESSAEGVAAAREVVIAARDMVDAVERSNDDTWGRR